MRSANGKGYTKNLLLAATLISLSTTMPMAVAYADNPTPTRGANAAYTITAGSESNYNFKTTDGTNTQYWLINLTADKLNGQHVTFSSSNNGGTPISISLPNGKIQTLYYTYTKPTTPVNYDIIQLPTKDLGTFSANEDNIHESGFGVVNNPSGNNITLENKLYQNNKLTASTNDRNVARLETKYLTLDAGNIHNEGTIESITADFINNQTELNVSNDNPSVQDNRNWHLRTYVHGGAIYNKSNIGDITGDFIGNSVTINQTYEGVEHYAEKAIARGGAIYTQGGTTIGNITGDFINNSASAYKGTSEGGAIYNYRGTIGNITGNVIGNSATEGGFIYNRGGGENYKDAIIGDLTGNFINNSSKSYGSVIYNQYGKIGNITGDFINNISNSGDGAIYSNYGEIKDITGDFISNLSALNIAQSKIGKIKGNFIENRGNEGAAIQVSGGYSTIESIEGNFIGNYYEGSSNKDGGAINNNSGEIGNIAADFIGNYVKNTGSTGSANGGAIYDNWGTLGDITGNFIGNYVDASTKQNESYGGAIFSQNSKIGAKVDDEYSGTAISGTFKDNKAITGGGAIAFNYSTVGDIAANFENNRVLNEEELYAGAYDVYGGAIYSGDSYVSIKSITGNFTNNSAKAVSGNAYGGAIYNDRGSIGTIKGNFSNNSVEANAYAVGGGFTNAYARGGAIYSTADITLTDSSFTNNSAVSKNSEGASSIYSYGGAINMDGGNLVINAVDSAVSFEGNSAYQGGAIYNNNSSKAITLNALNKDITFTNNNRTGAEGGSGDGIYTNGALNLNASNGKITVNDQIYANGGMNINDGTEGNVKLSKYVYGYANLKGGTLEVADRISGNINLYGGTIKFSENALTTDTSTKSFSLGLAGNSILDMQNNTAGEVVTISNLSGNSELKFNADYDATANKMDKLTVNGGSGTITLNAVNVLNDDVDFVDETQTTYLDGAARDNVTVITSAINSTTVTSDGKVYVFTPLATHGLLSVTRGIKYNGNLIDAIQDRVGTTHPTAFTMKNDFTAETENFGALNTDNRESFTIFGNNHTISGGNTYTGIEVASGQTLNLDNVTFSNVKDYDVQNAGTLNLSGDNTINTITGATGTANITGGTTTIAENGSVTQNAVNLQNGRLVIAEGATVNKLASSSDYAFVQNVEGSNIQGGAIKNAGTITNITGTFANNTAQSSGNYNKAQGGAIYNSGSITTINADFTANKAKQTGSNNYNYNTAGGAIQNYDGTIGTVTGTFEDNSAKNDNSKKGVGGAINNFYDSNNTQITNINADFTSNEAYYGGAISNYSNTFNKSAVISAISGKTDGNKAQFTSNTAYNSGGAIYNNSSTIDSLNADFTTNKVEGYLGSTGVYSYGGAIYNQAAKNTSTISNITGKFEGNSVSSINSGLDARAYGGAIFNTGSNTYQANLNNIAGSFVHNYAYAKNSFSTSVKEASAFGGAIYNNQYGNIDAIRVNFTGNYAKAETPNSATTIAEGGAIYNAVNGSIGYISGVTFGGAQEGKANYALANSTNGHAYGGAIYNAGTIGDIENSVYSISNSRFEGNYVSSPVAAFGGAIYSTSDLYIKNTDFVNNKAIVQYDQNSKGGAIYQDGGTLLLEDSSFTGNIADKGAAIYANNTNVTVYAKTENVEFTNNNSTGAANGSGTGIYLYGGSLTLNADTNKTLTINDNVDSSTGMTINAGGTHAGTVALNGVLTLGGDTSIQGGTLKLGTGAATSDLNAVTFTNTPTLDLQNSSVQTTIVSSISGNAKLNIDIDFTGTSVVADAINITTGGQTGVITLNPIAALNSDDDIKEFSNLAILTGETAGVTLAISDALQADTRFNGAAVEILTWESDYSDTATFAKSVFTNTEYSETKQKHLSIVDGTKLSFAETTTIPKHATGNITTQDVLQALNQSTNNGRYLNATETNKNYTVGADLGVTGTGRIEVQGVAGSNLNMNSKSGFELSNANTVLYLGQLNISGVKDIEGGLISITGENSYADLSDVTIEDTTNSVILNNGTLNSYSTNNLGTGITGTGTMIVDNGKTTIGSVVQDSVTIDSALGELEVQNITTTNGITNNGKLTLTGNANANTISGTGHTTIAGNVNNTRAINQAITVNGSKTLTTAANLIGGTVTNSGTVELTGGALGQTITGGDITIASGEVTSTVANLGGDITNDATLNLSGTLDKNIAGTEGITKLADNMTFADGAGVAGTLNFNGKAITMSGDDATSTFNIGKINSDGTINIDVNTSGSPVSDVINITTAGSTGTITINSINEIGARGDDFTLNVLQGTTGSLQLALSDAVHSQFDQAQQHNIYYVSDAYDATIDFDKTSFNTAEWDKVTQKAISIEDNTKIKYSTNVISDTPTGNVTQKDALAFINQNTDTSAVAARSMVTSDTDKTYTVQEDLGTTGAGTLLVQGASDGTTKLDMNNKTGFVVSNSGTTVTLKDINVNNVQNSDGALVNITNTGSSATLDGAVVNVKDNPENKANVISSNGSVTVKDSTVNAGINNTGTLDFEGTSKADKVSGSTGTTNVKGQTTIGSIVQKLVDIVTGGKLIANGDVTTGTGTGEGIKNAVAEGLEINNGTLTGNVTGLGSTDFKGTSAIADGSKVGQAITVVDGKLTTLADGLGGAVTNSGEVDLTGGTLETSITGGNTTISGNVGVDDTNGLIASAVKVETGAKLTTNADKVTGAINNGGDLDLTGGDIKNTISGDGNTTISGTVTNSTGSAIGNAVTVATTGNLTTAADKLGGAVSNSGTVQLNGGTLSQTITGGNLNIKDSVLTSADNLKADTTTVAASKDLTLNGGNLTKDITGSGNTKIAGTVTNSANIQTATEITSGSLDNTNGQLGDVTVTSGSLKSDASKVGAVDNAGTYEITGGTIANAISGSGAVNITGNTTNNVVNTNTGAVSVANNVELAVGTSGDAFASASSLTMGNGSTLNIQNGSATSAAIQKLVIAEGSTVNLIMDWNDTLNSTDTSAVAGNVVVSDINMATSTSSYEATSYTFTNLGNKVALSDPVSLSGVTDSTNNFVSYNNSTGALTSFRNSLVRAVDKTEAGETATYVMTGDETAGGQTLEGKLLVQGNGNTIITSGVKVQSSTATPAELTLQDVNMNVAGKAIEVTGNNKVIVEASGHDITLQTTDSSDVVSLNKAGTADYAQAEFKGAKTVNITGDIVSDDVNNTLTIASGATVNHAGLLDPITTNVSGTYNRTSGYDEKVTYNVNAGGQLNFTNDTTLYDAGHHTAALLNTINFNGGSVNTINGVVTDFQLANMSLTGTTNNFYADVDLANQTMDKFTVANPVTGSGTLNVAGLNLISDATSATTTINFTTDPVLMAATTYTGSQGLTALSPIYKYNVGYDNTTGDFEFNRYNSGGYGDYNPGILASPVAAQLGGYLVQLNSYDEAFRNMDMYMLMTKKEREAMKLRNKIASTQAAQYDDSKSMYEYNAGWFRPYASFEKVPLHNGPKVENIMYGSFFGGESELKDLGHGWDGMWGAYVGYNGSHQNYDGVSIYQNGGTLGLVGMAYKGNYFLGGTINAGANAGEASTSFGQDNFTMLMAGIAAKTGYNFEFANGKFIVQPNLQMSYSMVNTFDYTNAAGVRMDSDPLHAIQIEPGVKFIGNLKNGWQPYAGVSMVFNIMDRTHFQANNVSLPNLSVNPYVKYGVGVRKTWGERLTGFFQAFLMNGGRNGVGLQAGFRWAIGKESKNEVTKNAKTPQLKETKINLSSAK